MIHSYEGFVAHQVLNYSLVTHCALCEEPFSKKNVFSRQGWHITQTDHICEICFEEECQRRLYDGFNPDEDS